jgi:arylsulfatase A-like enzyme
MLNSMKNIILITVDSLRADYCSYIGEEEETTPFMDQLADQGLAFTNAVAPGPSTTQSIPAMMTGVDPFNREEITSEEIYDRRGHLYPHITSRETIAEYFSRLGYTTGGFTPNPYTSRYMGYSSGFDHFQDYIEGGRSSAYDILFKTKLKNTRAGSLFRMGMNWIQQEEVFKPWESYIDEVTEWVDSSDNPYFLWLHNMDVHFPFFVNKEYRSQSAIKMYRSNWKFWRAHMNNEPISERTRSELITSYKDSIRYFDDFLREIHRKIVDEDTIFVIHSDHGEAFGEHDVLSHGNHLYQENIHVPLVVSGVSNSKTIDDPISLRNMKDILRYSIEDKSNLKTEGFPNARILDDSRVAVVGKEWKYIDKGQDGDLFDISDRYDTKTHNSELSSAAKRYVKHLRANKKENKKISKAVSGLGLEDL